MDSMAAAMSRQPWSDRRSTPDLQAGLIARRTHSASTPRALAMIKRPQGSRSRALLGWAVKTTITKKDRPEFHLRRPDVATIFFHMDFLVDGQPMPGLQRAMILVATATHGDWKISAGQLTRESPAASK
ncbi:hypothetical protein [Phenylobacterium sp.]|uniref:hypothetical protein n=1 Tax=Phenylobacterium sp. TaxID=1871053 RepID=UPI0025DDC1BA|nr:hypothetical protein [Phenylobacterium sp.]